MNIVSYSLFHFTSELGIVKSILQNGFRLHYCSEEVYLSSNQHRVIGIPMVCFCDLPLVHIGTNGYGKYSIGMNKTWGWQVANLQPVFYYPNNANCSSTKEVIKASKAFVENKGRAEYTILGTAKPYHKIEKTSDGACNYTDREWRAVGTDEWLRDKDPRFNEFCNVPRNRKPPIGEGILFDSKYVDFIIVPEKRRMEMIQFIWEDLNHCCGKVLSETSKLTLISKVISREQLMYNI